MADIRIGMDISDLTSKASQFQSALQANGQAVEDFLIKSAQFNKEGQLRKFTAQSISPSGDAVEQVARLVKRVNKDTEEVTYKWQVVSTTVKAASDKVNEFADAQRRAKEEARGVSAAGFVGEVAGTFDREKVTAASAAKQSQLAGAQSRLVKAVAESGLEQDALRDIFSKIQAGQIEVEAGARARVQKALLDLVKAYKSIGDEAEKAAKKQQAAAEKAAKESETAVQKIGKSILISWEGIVRLLESQTIRYAFRALVHESIAAVQQFAKLSVEIGRIQAITQEAGYSTLRWSQQLRGLSDNYNVSLVDTASAAYALLRTRLVGAGESASFLSRGLELSQVYGLSANQSVSLLTDTMRSFGLQSGEVNRVVGVLSTAVESGNVDLTEFEHRLRQIGPTAKALGISLEEMSAAVSTLTVQGVRTSQAISTIESITHKLLRPSEEMKRLFREWGVASGEAAVATFGFGGTLQKLQAEIQKGGLSKLSELEGDFRAIRGVIGLTGNSFRGFQEQLEKTADAQQKFKKSQEIIRDTFGHQFQEGVNRLHNAFTVDLAQDFVTTVVSWTKPIGGLSAAVDKLIATLKLAASAAVAYGVAVVTVRTVTATWAASTVAVQAVLNAFPLTATRFTAGVSAMVASVRSFIAANAATVAQLAITGTVLAYTWIKAEQDAREAAVGISQIGERERRLQDEYMQEYLRRSDAERAALKRSYDERFRIVLNYFALVRAEINKQEDETLRHRDPLSTILGKNFDEVLKKYKKETEDLRHFIESTRSAITSSGKSERSIREHSDSGAFERSIAGLSEREKFDKTLDKVHQLQKEGVDLFNKGVKVFDVENIEEARKKLDEAEKLLGKIDTLREVTQNIKHSRGLERSLRDSFELENFNLGLKAYQGAGGPELGSTRATLQFAEKLKLDAKKLFEEGVKTFNVENIEEARKKLEEVDKLFTSLLDKQLSFRQKAAKLGVVFTTPALGPNSEIDSLRLGNQQARLKLEKEYQQSEVTRARALLPEIQRSTELRIALEKRLQQAQTERLQKALGLEKLLLAQEQELLKLEQARSAAADRRNGAIDQRNKSAENFKQDYQRYQELLLDVEKFKSALYGTGFKYTFMFDKRGQDTYKQLQADIQKFKELQEAFNKNPSRTADDFAKLQAQAQQVVLGVAKFKQAMIANTGIAPDKATGKLPDLYPSFNGTKLEDLDKDIARTANKIDKDLKAFQKAGEDIQKVRGDSQELDKLLEQIPEKYRSIGKAAQEAADAQKKAAEDIVGSTKQALENLKQIQQQLEAIKSKEVPRLEAPSEPPKFQPGTPAGKPAAAGLFTTPAVAQLGAPDFEPRIGLLAPEVREVNNETSTVNRGVYFGDVNVTVQGGSTERQAREIAQMIRREVQRGNSLLS